MALVTATGLVKTYTIGEVRVEAIRGVDFTIDPGAFVSFVGPSGSGKSTLLNMIGCLDQPTGGALTVAGQEIRGLSRSEAARFRGETIGFIFQDFNLIPVLTVYENVEYPLRMVQKRPAAERRQRVMALLDAVGMADQANKYPSQISGGQKQRVAVARALITNAKLVLADEPTANLDRETAERIIELMKKLRNEFKTTFVFSTHDPRVVRNAETIYTLEDGKLSSAKEAGHA
ncbi:MAG TPA: ABC transporter ATP-binding protein [Desulfurivibrionaceae bacterium]|nr:ABC transporter ATP-binding protein [Desulfurivibrionaceae bacterium]